HGSSHAVAGGLASSSLWIIPGHEESADATCRLVVGCIRRGRSCASSRSEGWVHPARCGRSTMRRAIAGSRRERRLGHPWCGTVCRMLPYVTDCGPSPSAEAAARACSSTGLAGLIPPDRGTSCTPVFGSSSMAGAWRCRDQPVRVVDQSRFITLVHGESWLSLGASPSLERGADCSAGTELAA